jgi:cell wall-associated NlpC family hydrolase|tara:strand:+ start:615 stop:1469 length:855 start_codon:yes stop_codon:yes gene_type:complete
VAETVSPLPDRRRNLYRSDLAEAGLEGVVPADRYVTGAPARICQPIVPGRLTPNHAKPRDTEFLMGEPVLVFDRADNLAWVKSQRDGYVGYIDQGALIFGAPAPTHRVNTIRSHLYPAPELKRFALAALPYGALVTVIDRTEKWAKLADGQWVALAHLVPVSQTAKDPVAEAMRFLGVPYLWGGRSSDGMDCSALVQFALEACGIPCPRDSDMQEAELGRAIDRADLQATDLIFWPGHVGMMMDRDRMIHANATDMAVRVWTLSDFEAHIIRIEGHEIRTIKRL